MTTSFSCYEGVTSRRELCLAVSAELLRTFLMMLFTVSDGCAPTLSQYSARSSFSVKNFHLSSSDRTFRSTRLKRPSRGLRLSVTAMR